MGDFNFWRWGAYAGFAFVVLHVAAEIAYFSGGTSQDCLGTNCPWPPPIVPDAAKLTTYMTSSHTGSLAASWFSSLGGVIFVPFLVGVRQAIRAARGEWEWSAGVVFAAGVSWTLMRIIHNGMLVGAFLGTNAGTALAASKVADAAGGVGFTFDYLFGALLMATTSYVVWQTAVLPRWTAWVGYVAAVLNFIMSLFIFFEGGSPFFGLIWPTNLILGIWPVLVWAVCLSIAMLGSAQARRSRQAA